LRTLYAMWLTCRPYLMYVSGAAGLVGLALAHPSIATVLPAFVALFASYGLGQALTDVFQTDTDALSAPERPLVRGTIDKRTVLIASLGGLAVCAAVIVALAPSATLPAVISVAMLATYTPLKRRWWGGPPWNSAVVALLPLLGCMAGGMALAEALADRAVLAAMVSSFGTYAVFVLLGYLKDVDADRATQYNTIAVRFGRRAAIIGSAAFAGLGLAASVWLIEPRLAPSAGAILWDVGVVGLIVAHLLAWRSKSDADAWPGIQASVHGFVALHLGEAALIEPKWTGAAWLLFAASIAAMLRRPVRRQV
jgi:4-hydroxybenzoate polyprenyltransferase